MKKDIAIILTLFENEDYDHYLNYWSSKISKIRLLGYEVIIINDNPNADFSAYFNLEIYNNKKNLGKFLSIYDYIRSNTLTSNYFFSCDPDDLLSIDSLERINSQIVQQNESYDVISLDSFKFDIEHRDKIINLVEEDNYHGNIPINDKRLYFTNWTTILNVNSIKNDKIYNAEVMKIKTLCEDLILGLIAYNKNYKLLELKDNFYFYCSANGVTSNLNSDTVGEFIDGIMTYYQILKLTKNDYRDNFKGYVSDLIIILEHYRGQNLIDNEQYVRFNAFLIEMKNTLIS